MTSEQAHARATALLADIDALLTDHNEMRAIRRVEAIAGAYRAVEMLSLIITLRSDAARIQAKAELFDSLCSYLRVPPHDDEEVMHRVAVGVIQGLRRGQR